MTGKLDLDLGEDYAFDPRRAKAVAEGLTAVAEEETAVTDDAADGDIIDGVVVGEQAP